MGPSRRILALIILLIPFIVYSQYGNENLFKEMKWRCIGPANFAGRVVDVEALDSDFAHVVVASASGGVWKSINAGTTWEPIFDHYGSASIGDIKIFQINPDIIWVGTGEANNRNSVAWGDGIYKSKDGGETFTNMGLKDTYQIARIVTHPENPDIVYVAAIGYLWGYIGERGLFKTVDGGKSWEKLTNGLPDDGKTGATDLLIDPTDPNILYVAYYQRLRKPYRFDSGGSNGGIFKSKDGGGSWTKLTTGLPPGETGRIGLDIYRKNPKILMAMIEHSFQPRFGDPDYKDMSKLGTGIYRSEDGGETWQFVNRYNNRPFYYSQLRIHPHDDQLVYALTTTIRLSEDGGKTFRPGGLEFEGGLDYHAMWFDPTNRNRYYLGKDKGLTLTHDFGKTFILYDNMPIGQFYALGVDMRDPYFVYGGTQDNGTWGGPSFSRDVRGILSDDWWKLHWGDGMFIQIDPTDWRKVYTEAEGGSFRRYDALTRKVESTRPNPLNVVNYSDFVSEGTRNSGGRLPSQFRFNWRSPLIMSAHNPRTLFLGGNHLFKTDDEGYHWQIISPELSTNDPVKIDRNSGGLTRDVTGAETHCSITTFSESPIDPQILWVGMDDGNIQITKNGGETWANVRKNIQGVPNGIWVSCVETSHFEGGTCYITFDGHRSAELSTWIYKTDDFGKSWKNISNNLPDNHPLYVIREDLKNRNLLFAGSEFTCFVSINCGETWTPFMNNMPTVAFHDLVIHPRDGDLIAGTHGRSFWILDDITPLQQLNEDVLNSDGFIFNNRPITLWKDASRGGVRGHQFYAGENPPYIPKRSDVVRAKLMNGGLINYYLKTKPSKDIIFEISDDTGKLTKVLSVDGEVGINRLSWNLRFDPTVEQIQQNIEQLKRTLAVLQQTGTLDSDQKKYLIQVNKDLNLAKTMREVTRLRSRLMNRFRNISSLRRSFSGGSQGPMVEPGEYQIKMTVDGKVYTNKITVREDPMLQ